MKALASGNCGSSFGTLGSARKKRRRTIVRSVSAKADPYKTLKVSTTASRREIKTSYYALIKQIHPDVNASMDATEQAAQLNAAYQELMEILGQVENSTDDDDDFLDVFDRPESSPSELFVNPFGCYGVPLGEWRTLQELARDSPQDPATALRELHGVQVNDGAVYFLTKRQLEIVENELDRAAMAMDVTSSEVCESYLTNILLRARVANNRI